MQGRGGWEGRGGRGRGRGGEGGDGGRGGGRGGEGGMGEGLALLNFNDDLFPINTDEYAKCHDFMSTFVVEGFHKYTEQLVSRHYNLFHTVNQYLLLFTRCTFTNTARDM